MRACVRGAVYRTVRFVPGRHASLRQHLPEQTVSVSGMSKEVSGTGLRLGFCAGPQHLISLIRSIQSNSSSCVNLPTQRAYEMLIRHDIAHDMELRSGVVSEPGGPAPPRVLILDSACAAAFSDCDPLCGDTPVLASEQQ